MKVLIVDDSPLIRVRLAALLDEVEGIEIVAQADNADQAVDLVIALQPDVAIVDVRIPRRSGMDLIEDVKKTRQPPQDHHADELSDTRKPGNFVPGQNTSAVPNEIFAMP